MKNFIILSLFAILMAFASPAEASAETVNVTNTETVCAPPIGKVNKKTRPKGKRNRKAKRQRNRQRNGYKAPCAAYN